MTLSQTFYPRNSTQLDNLTRCAEYIAGHFTRAGATVEYQAIEVEGKTYQNVIGRFKAGQGERVIVGAHYDSSGDTPGADDNASGVAALIELAYLFGKNPPAGEVELVAYVNEEPPFFRMEQMGSVVHARRAAGQKIKGVIVFEMVGYFRNEAYHEKEDTADRLDYVRMAKVVVAVSAAVRTL